MTRDDRGKNDAGGGYRLPASPTGARAIRGIVFVRDIPSNRKFAV